MQSVGRRIDDAQSWKWQIAGCMQLLDKVQSNQQSLRKWLDLRCGNEDKPQTKKKNTFALNDIMIYYDI